jgi:endoribonuclease LACTB2
MPITQAASVVLIRGSGSPELFVVRRAETLRFFGGYYAFPGGKVAPNDASAENNVFLVAAVRELFEETGILLARRADGTFSPSGPDLINLRKEVLEERASFPDLLARIGVRIQTDDLHYIGRLVTPPFTAIRFDTAFYIATLPANQATDVWPGELAEGEWLEPAALLTRWSRGECLISPPSLMLLQEARNHALDELPQRLASLISSLDGGALPPIYFAPEVQLLPLVASALPPSTHTNAYLVGRDPAYLIDPGPENPKEQQRLFQVLDTQRALGCRLAAVVLTHHHRDHVGAARVCSDRYGAPIWAHGLTARMLKDKLKVSHEIEDGDCLELGAAPDGQPWHLEALHTPGHAAGHLAFYEPHYRLLFAGDMVSTQSSILIVPPDGDLSTYLASLRRLRALDCRLLLPAHGSPSAQAAKTLDECLAHRAKRERQLLEALAAGPRTVRELVEALYRGTPASLQRMAELQIRAGLRKLLCEGQIETRGDGDEASWNLQQAR